MDLIQEYLCLVTSIISDIEYAQTTCFADFCKDHNRKVMRMRSIAGEIEKDYSELKDKFCDLLSHEELGVRLWVAHHVLEVMNCEQNQRKAALTIIRYEAKTNKTANGFGEKIWLKDWYKSHPKDRWL